MRRLDGKVILVAGAGGIGGELARRFAREGAAVVLGDVDPDAARIVAEEIGDDGGRATGLLLDGSEETAFADAVALCVGKYGGLDGAHFNFATFVDSDEEKSVIDLPLDVYDETIHINQRGYLLGTRAVLPAILERGGGSLVYTSSVAAYRSGGARLAYAMAKAAGHALMRHVAERFGAEGVRANAIAPGTIMHGKWDRELPQEMKDSLMGLATLKTRLGRPNDIAGLSALLMSEDGAYITGQVICVDGGITMRA
jgi:NAD(P)-dependent dehydrogenase (short-subunit alcohol dehydrogenase family)